LRILVTGPSCSGKTTYCRALAGRRIVELDSQPSLEGLLSAPEDEALLFEGIPSGSDSEMANFVSRMDLILLLTTSFEARLQRMLARDGPAGLGRFLYNEFAWRSFVAGLFEGNARVWRVSEKELPDDPFQGFATDP
jgi:energy-coupling factor transporter ATP-binding protein EcfA2